MRQIKSPQPELSTVVLAVAAEWSTGHTDAQDGDRTVATRMVAGLLT